MSAQTTVKRILKKYAAGFLVVGALCFLVLISYGASFARRSDSVLAFNIYSHDGVAQDTNFWKGEIQKLGAKPAYALFLRTYANLKPGDQHTQAHIFGAALFLVEGLPGLSTCDASFSYGCFHEFLARAIETGGLSQVTELNQDCYNAVGPTLSLTCTHGLGHGIQAYLGYGEDALVKSLDICKNLPYSDPIGGCPGGVFMEYNLRTMHSFEGMPIREPVHNDLLYPCDTLPTQYSATCYYWQPQWQQQVLLEKGKNKDEAFTEIGDLCRSIPVSFQKQCFEGTGIIVAAAANFDVTRAISLCNETAEAGVLRATCLGATASSFAGEPSVKDKAKDLCTNLKGNELNTCVHYITHTMDHAASEEKL